MEKIVGYFTYDEHEYYIVLKDKIILFCIKETGTLKMANNLDNEVLNRIEGILKIHKDSSYLSRVEIFNNKKYVIYYDKVSSMYYWDNVDQDDGGSNIKFNFKYNHMPTVLYNDISNSNNDNNTFFTKFIRIKNKFIPIFLAANLTLTMLAGCAVLKPEQVDASTITASSSVTEIEQETSSGASSIIEEKKEEYSYEAIRYIIENNPYLSNEEKDFIYKLQFVFDDYHDYMDMPLVKTRLSYLKTNYELQPIITVGLGTGGSYNYKTNVITFNSESFEKTNISIFLHELFHVFQIPSRYFTLELSDEFFTREILLRLYKENILPKEAFLGFYTRESYKNGKDSWGKDFSINSEEEWLYYITTCGGFGDGYPGYETIYQILAELVSKETLLKYQFNPENLDPLVEDLASLEGEVNNDTIAGARSLINKINDLREWNPEKGDYEYYQDGSKCLELLNYYYKLKFGKELLLNLEMALNLLNSNIRVIDFGLNQNDLWYFWEDQYHIDFAYSSRNLTGKTLLSDVMKTNIMICYEKGVTKIFFLDEEMDYQYEEYMNRHARAK